MAINWLFILQLLINGILLGGLYATMSLGFSTIWGVMRLINLAHGEFLFLAAFVAWFFFNPEREQNLTLSMYDAGSTSPLLYNGFVLLIFVLVSAIIGYLISNSVGKDSIPNDKTRRLIGVGTFAVLGAILFFSWNSADFIPINISMMSIIMVSLMLSIGFVLSHIVWRTILDKTVTLLVRVASYGIGAIVTWVFYILWQSTGLAPIDPFLSLPLIFILFFSLGYALQIGFLNRLVEGPYLTMLLVTFAISIILQNLMLTIYTADPRRINVEYNSAIQLGSENLTIGLPRLITLIVSVGMVIGLMLFLRYTRTGYAIRAAAQNKMAAKLMGINIKEVYALTMAVSLALTAMAGTMMVTFQPFTPVDGPKWTLRAFAIVALGGLGKVEGVVVGALVLGITESFIGGYIGVGWAITAAFVLLVLMLVVRPQGLTGGLVSAEE